MHLISVLAQAGNTSIPWERVFDNGLSLGILAIVAKVLWNKMQKQDDRLTSLQDRDRAVMLDIMEKNTRVMERNNQVMEKNTEVMERNIQVMEKIERHLPEKIG